MAEGPFVCEDSKLDGGHTVSPPDLEICDSGETNNPLDYRQKGDVTCSKQDSQGRFVNPWSTWQFPSYSTTLRLFLMEKNNSNIPSAKEVTLHTLNYAHTQVLYMAVKASYQNNFTFPLRIRR